jgi:tRNA threonylcarbamoyladenosine biosynthesis protein TsaB
LPPEPIVLAFDTSAAHCAAALVSGGRVLALHHEPMDKGQAEYLMPMLTTMLEKAGVTWRDLRCIGVGTGPGNFTGVRISVAAARGLALGLGIPAVGVTALEAQVFGIAGPVISSLDARRGLIYLQAFAPEGAAMICDAAALPALSAATCVGHEAHQVAKACAGQVAASAVPLTEAIARIALARTGTGIAPGRHSAFPRPAPFYLRGADAAPSSDPPPVILP